MTSLAEYYRSIGLSPVEHDVVSERKLLLHCQRRRNLIEHSLNFPFRLWKGAHVLEFGPGSGENAIVAALAGARFTFVEPLDYLIAKLRANFKAHKLERSIVGITLDGLETYSSPAKYEVVIAEGFIQFLDDKPKAVRKLGSLVAPDGFLMVSVVHPSGTFVESFKSTLLRLCGKERARDLFGEDFDKINHSRSFESWLGDTLLNPLYHHENYMELDTVLGALGENFSLHGSWPGVPPALDLTWHKSLRTAKELRTQCLDAYYAHFPHFIHSRPGLPVNQPLFDPKAGRRIAAALNGLYPMIETGSPAQVARTLRRLAAIFEKFPESKLALALLRECIKVIEAADPVKAYAKSKLLRSSWGSPGHHYCLKRRENTV